MSSSIVESYQPTRGAPSSWSTTGPRAYSGHYVPQPPTAPENHSGTSPPRLLGFGLRIRSFLGPNGEFITPEELFNTSSSSSSSSSPTLDNGLPRVQLPSDLVRHLRVDIGNGQMVPLRSYSGHPNSPYRLEDREYDDPLFHPPPLYRAEPRPDEPLCEFGAGSEDADYNDDDPPAYQESETRGDSDGPQRTPESPVGSSEVVASVVDDHDNRHPLLHPDGTPTSLHPDPVGQAAQPSHHQDDDDPPAYQESETRANSDAPQRTPESPSSSSEVVVSDQHPLHPDGTPTSSHPDPVDQAAQPNHHQDDNDNDNDSGEGRGWISSSSSSLRPLGSRRHRRRRPLKRSQRRIIRCWRFLERLSF